MADQAIGRPPFTRDEIIQWRATTPVGGSATAGMPSAPPAQQTYPPGTKAKMADGSIVQLNAMGQWEPVAAETQADAGTSGSMVTDMLKRALVGAVDNPVTNTLGESAINMGKIGLKAARDTAVGLGTLPRDIEQTIDISGLEAEKTKLADLHSQLAQFEAAVQNRADLPQEVVQAQREQMLTSIDQLQTRIAIKEQQGPGLATQMGNAIEGALPPQPTGHWGLDMGADITRFMVPGVAGANIAGKALQGAPLAARALGQGAAAIATDTAVALPGHDMSIGDMVEAGPTQTATKETPVGKRLAVGAEGGAAAVGVEAAMGVIGQFLRRYLGVGADTGQAAPGPQPSGPALPGPGPRAPETPGGDSSAFNDNFDPEEVFRQAREDARRKYGKSDEEMRAEAQAETESAFRDAGGQQRGRQQRQQQSQQQKPGTEKPAYDGYTNKAATDDEPWLTDDYGHATDASGKARKFASQKMAARWILGTGNKRGRQVFEVANHPDGNGFAVRVRGMHEPEPRARPQQEAPRQEAPRQAADASAATEPPPATQEPQFSAPSRVGDDVQPATPRQAPAAPDMPTLRERYVARHEAETLARRLRDVAAGKGELTPEELAPRGTARQTIDQTAQGEQRVVPGAERITDKELAERGMAGPARAKAPQQAADDGLFDVAGRSQQDLWDAEQSRLADLEDDAHAKRLADEDEITEAIYPIRRVTKEDPEWPQERLDEVYRANEHRARQRRKRSGRPGLYDASDRAIDAKQAAANERVLRMELEPHIKRGVRVPSYVISGIAKRAQEQRTDPMQELLAYLKKHRDPAYKALTEAEPSKPKATDPADKVRGILRNPKVSLTPAAVAKHLGIDVKDARKGLNSLAAKGEIRQKKDGSGYTRKPNTIKSGRPMDAIELIARAGGVRDTDGHDLAKGRGLQRFVPGVGNLIRPGGMGPDELGEFLQQEGFFRERPTEAEVLEFLERARYEKQYAGTSGDALGDALDAQAARQADEGAAELRDRIDFLREEARAEGIEADDEMLEEAVRKAHAEGRDDIEVLGDMLEDSYRGLDDDLRQAEPHEAEDIPGFERGEDEAGGASTKDGGQGTRDSATARDAEGEGRQADQGSGQPGAGGGGAKVPRGGNGRRGVTLSANPFANPALIRESAPELIGALVGGVYDNYQETGTIGISFRGAMIGAFAMSGVMRVPIRGKTLLGKGSHAAAARQAAPDLMKKVPGGKYFHPTGGVSEALYDKVLAMRQETRNWQVDAVKMAKYVHENFTAAERALMSDIIEKVDFPDAQGNVNAGGFQNADQRVKDMADALAIHAEDLGQRLVNFGMLDAQAFANLQGEYLHRYYKPKITRELSRFLRLRENINGSWGRRRGETHVISSGGNLRVGTTLTKMVNPVTGGVRYVDASRVQGYINRGWVAGKVWKVDAMRGGKAVLWRDYTPLERRAMGEIREAHYRFARGMMEASHDLALGQMFDSISRDTRWASRTQQGDWVYVSDAKVPGTNISKYGNLAGMYVHPEVMDAIALVRKPWTNSQVEGWNTAMRSYLKALGAWKVGKTVYNPATHFNNIMGNVGQALLHDDVNALDVAKAIKAFRTDAPIVEEARRAGLALDVNINVGDELSTIERDLAIIGNDPRSGWSKLLDKIFHNKVADLYNKEDAVFKLASYAKQRAAGVSAKDAVKHAHSLYFDYSDVPLGIQAMRDFYVPFISYSYKFLPSLAKVATERPHAVVAAFGLLSAVNMYSYSSLYPDAPLGREEYERELMPDYTKGRSSMGAERMLRLPWNRTEPSGEERAMFLNSRYFLPGGDLLDMTNNAAIGPSFWPQALGGTPLGGNPLLTSFGGWMFDKDPFFGKKIYPYPDADLTDPDASTRQKVANIKAMAGFFARQWGPPIFTWSPNKVGEALVGEGYLAEDNGVAEFFNWTGTDFAGRKLRVEQALLQIFGIKATDIGMEEREKFRTIENYTRVRDARKNVIRTNNNAARSQGEREEAMLGYQESVDQYNDEATEMQRLKKGAGL